MGLVVSSGGEARRGPLARSPLCYLTYVVVRVPCAAGEAAASLLVVEPHCLPLVLLAGSLALALLTGRGQRRRRGAHVMRLLLGLVGFVGLGRELHVAGVGRRLAQQRRRGRGRRRRARRLRAR